MSEFDLVTISLGAGVQSSTIYLMACEGLIEPMPDVAIFADTQVEPPWVYEHLEWLKKNGSIRIDVVTAGSIEDDVLQSRDGRSRFASIPLRVMGKDGRPALLRRQCTREYKIDPIRRRVRDLLGLKPRQVAKGRFLVQEWIGISKDEAHRAKPSRDEWIQSRWPLLFDVPMSRQNCKDWLYSNGYPIPERSACYFCPFHDDRFWLAMKTDHPDEFERAVVFDRQIRNGKLRGMNDEAFLHRSLRPLEEVDFGTDASNQLELDFGNECEGMCGV